MLRFKNKTERLKGLFLAEGSIVAVVGKGWRMKERLEEWQLLAASQINNMWMKAQQGRDLPPDASTVARVIADWMPAQRDEFDEAS